MSSYTSKVLDQESSSMVCVAQAHVIGTLLCERLVSIHAQNSPYFLSRIHAFQTETFTESVLEREGH